MSTSFKVFPIRNKIPECSEIISYSVNLFKRFLEENNVNADITVNVRELLESANDNTTENPKRLISKSGCDIFGINGDGEIYVNYCMLDETEKSLFLNDIRDIKENVNLPEDCIESSFSLGYYWSIERAITQPPLASLYYGYLAIAVAFLTGGVIYTDDDAWDEGWYSVYDFRKRYLKTETLKDDTVRNSIEMWLCGVKKSYGIREENDE